MQLTYACSHAVFIRIIMPSRRALLSRLVLSTLLACAGPAVLAQSAPVDARPPIASFFEHSAFGRVLLSPSGKYLAVRSSAVNRRDFLVVIELATKKATVAAAFDDSDINDFQWVNDDRLLFNMAEKQVGQGDKTNGPGLYAVDHNGEHLAQLVSRYWQQASRKELMGKVPQQAPHTYLLHQRPRNDDYTYVTSPSTSGADLRYVDLIRLDTRTGNAHRVPRPDGPVGEWWLDHKGEPRLASASKDGTTTLSYLDPATSAWRTLTSFPTYGADANPITPVGFGPDGTLYVRAYNGKDTQALYTFDLKAGKLNPEPLLVTKGYDFEGTLVTTRDKVLGARFTTDADSIEWFAPGMKAVQEKLDKLLPATMNLISVPYNGGSPWVLVTSYADTVPVHYQLYNTETGQIDKIGSTRPAIDPAQMGRQQMVRYKARDGLEIPALLTLPRKAGKNLPMVVLVHGGPWVNGAEWGWNPDSQFLASRGYAVLEPSFRGTTGLGSRHYRASFKQWGLSMQNDIADGTRWAIAQGYADPKRICIAGASYGGYATLMGLVNDPDLYKCGVDWVGVTDINLLYSDNWLRSSDASAELKKYGLPEQVGDQVKDAAQLKATSPIEQAARITQPLLLAYGGVDLRVPLYHGQKFHDAVIKTNKNVQWIEYPEEGHGWRLPKNSIDFWGKVETFLDKNIGKDAVIQ
jgi:dipeptidyl aminopeptidase/acylaminoacyl peptidase